jgi:hypothetical protein
MDKATAGKIPWMTPTATGGRLLIPDRNGKTLDKESKLEILETKATSEVQRRQKELDQ